MLATPSLLLFLILAATDAAIIWRPWIRERGPPLPRPGLIPDCGVVPKVAPIQKRMIVGGSGAQPEAWPWQVAVLDKNGMQRCGGTLISSEFVLTAAHCSQLGSDNYLKSIVAGEYNLTHLDSEDRQERLVAPLSRHPAYDSKISYDYDIALLRLELPVRLTTKVWPACLPKQGEELEPQTTATVLGWGLTSDNSNGEPQMLREARIPVVNLDDCRQSYGSKSDLITHNMVCAGYEDGRIGSYKGDSGGPLLVERDNRWYVHGVTAFSIGSNYALYSKTSSYIDWINEEVDASQHSDILMWSAE